MTYGLDITNEQLIGGDYNGSPKVSRIDRNGGLFISGAGGNGVESDITSDAWGRPKTITDFTLFHGLFTYDIPTNIWLTYEDDVEVTGSTRITSTDGHGSIKSGANITETAFLRSKRHPRYQPNRGHLFSTALFLPTPNATGIRKLGLVNTTNGCYFQLEDGVLYAVILDDGVEKIKTAIDLSQIGLTVDDLAYGHLYDVQFQWRGVGDYFFYIDQKLVYQTSFLGNNTTLTISNPAISVGYYSENTDGTEVEIQVGCCDVTSEGGKREGASYKSAGNATTKAVTGANYPLVIIKIPETYKGKPNTRDVLALRANGGGDVKGFLKAYITRDASAITGATFNAIDSTSSIEFDVGATAIDTAKCVKLWAREFLANDSVTVDLPSNLVDFYITAGDYLILTGERDNASSGNLRADIELGEEI